MAYQDRFLLADQYVNHLDASLVEVDDPFIASRYVGFVSVSAVTVYELAIRDIFVSFSEKKHNVFGQFARSYFDRINGRISTNNIVRDYLPRFGDKYVKKFCNRRDKENEEILKLERVNALTCYGNIITWRNQFAHEGQIPNTVTFSEVKISYETGKHVVHWLAKTMVR